MGLGKAIAKHLPFLDTTFFGHGLGAGTLIGGMYNLGRDFLVNQLPDVMNGGDLYTNFMEAVGYAARATPEVALISGLVTLVTYTYLTEKIVGEEDSLRESILGSRREGRRDVDIE